MDHGALGMNAADLDAMLQYCGATSKVMANHAADERLMGTS